MNSDAPIVDVENLSVQFGDFYAVRDVSFRVYSGQIFGFLGANGAGKTTTIRVLCGLINGTSGRVVIDGINFTSGRENEIKSRVGYMSQRFTLYNDLTVGENFDFAAALREIPQSVYIARRNDLLKFIGFDGKLDTVVKNLPDGTKQQVALCVSLLHDPKIIFLDEPTAGVAPIARKQFWEIIRNLSRGGKTVFVTTHYMDEAENCTRIALMRSGELIAVDSPRELKRKTFGDTLFNFTPRHAKSKLPPSSTMEMCEPYGRHFHIRFNDKISLIAVRRKYGADFEITSIAPSLEDVFIHLVEGAQK